MRSKKGIVAFDADFEHLDLTQDISSDSLVQETSRNAIKTKLKKYAKKVLNSEETVNLV